MKLLSMATSIIAIILLCSNVKKNAIDKSTLVNHKWTLVEITQKENDTLSNLTLFLTPCEKDNYTNYSDNGTYKIHEGVAKCNSTDNDVKGEGTWILNSTESTMTDSYQGGKKVTKKIITLTNEVLKIEYQGEGKKIFTSTYFSEEGKKDEANSDLIVDNSDASQNVTQIIKSHLLSTNRHILVSRKDFQNATRSNIDDKNGLLNTVAIMPFTNRVKESVNTKERNNQLIEQARRSDIDYVITGELINAETKANDKNDYVGSVRYEVYVLEIASGTICREIMSDKDEVKKPAAKRGGGSLLKGFSNVGKSLAVGALNVAGSLGGYALLGSNYAAYSTLFKAGRIVSAASTTASVFSDVNETIRSQTFGQNNATVEAVKKTSENLTTFVDDNTPVKIKIHSIEGDGKNAKIAIKAGSNIGLEKDMKLDVVRIVTISIAGSVSKERKIVGTIEVEKPIEEASECSFKDGKNDIIKAFKETPGELFVVPQREAPEKK